MLDLPTFEALHTIATRLAAVCDEVQDVAWDVEKFLGKCTDDETGRVVTLPTLEQIGALHAFRELVEMDRDELAGHIEKLVEGLTDLNLTRLDAAIQRA